MDEFHTHPNYGKAKDPRFPRFKNDIGLIVLKTPFKVGSKVFLSVTVYK